MLSYRRANAIILSIIFYGLLSALSAASPLLVGSEDIDYYPHYGKQSAQTEQLSGFIRDVLDAFSEHEKLTFSYRLMPVKRLYRAFLYDLTVDFKYPDNAHWNSLGRGDVTIYYSDPVVTVIDGVMTLSDRSEFCIEELLTLGTIRGFTPEPYLEFIGSGQVVLYEYSSTTDMLAALLAKRVDGIYMNVDVAYFQLTKMQSAAGRVRFNSQLPYAFVDYRLSTIKHSEILTAFNQYMRCNASFIDALKVTYGINRDNLPRNFEAPRSCPSTP